MSEHEEYDYELASMSWYEGVSMDKYDYASGVRASTRSMIMRAREREAARRGGGLGCSDAGLPPPPPRARGGGARPPFARGGEARRRGIHSTQQPEFLESERAC